MVTAGFFLFLSGFWAGQVFTGNKTAGATVEYLPDEKPRYTVDISQTIEYGLLYAKTDMITGETRMFIIKNGKLKPFLLDNSN